MATPTDYAFKLFADKVSSGDYENAYNLAKSYGYSDADIAGYLRDGMGYKDITTQSMLDAVNQDRAAKAGTLHSTIGSSTPSSKPSQFAFDEFKNMVSGGQYANAYNLAKSYGYSNDDIAGYVRDALGYQGLTTEQMMQAVQQDNLNRNPTGTQSTPAPVTGANANATVPKVEGEASAPWSQAQPYLLGQDGVPGVLPNAAVNYQAGNWSPEMAAAQRNYLQNLGMNAGSQQYMIDAGNRLMLNGMPAVQNAQFHAANPPALANLNLGNLGLGNAPKAAYEQMLSGKANTATLDPVVNSAIKRVTDNFNEQVMPSIGRHSVMANNYGSSRQGVAEGLAAKGVAQTIGDMSANMYNNAYNVAQNQMGTAATQLGGIASGLDMSNAGAINNMSQFNAGQANNMGQFNANLGLQNNQQYLSGMTTGANMAGLGMNGLGTTYQNTIGALGAPNQYNNANLTNYANLVNQAAGQGSVSTGAPTRSNNTATNLGIVSTLYGIGNDQGWW